MKVWILSLVKRGFIQGPEIFYNVSEAEERKQELIEGLNPDYDEIEVFEKRIEISGTSMINFVKGKTEISLDLPD